MGLAIVRHTWRDSLKESGDVLCSVLDPSVVGSDAAVAVHPYCVNAYAWGKSASSMNPLMAI